MCMYSKYIYLCFRYLTYFTFLYTICFIIGGSKMNITPVRLVRESDGFDVDENDILVGVRGKVLMLLCAGQSWDHNYAVHARAPLAGNSIFGLL